MNLYEHAAKIEKAALSVSDALFSLKHTPRHFPQTIAEGKTITGDLGGKASTVEFTNAIISKLGKA